MKVITLLVAALCVANVYGQKDPHFVAGRNTIVHLFEWKWSDIAAECENFLGPKGFGGVQISPPNENLVISNRPWYERYQPVSYVLTTRSGDEAALSDMIKRCNAVGVRIYVDAVINHMSADGGTGTAGSTCDANSKSYPAVPFSSTDFHATCSINNYNDAENVRNCELEGLKDLDQSVSWVREKIVEYFDHLVDLGVAGFRVDAAKHMYPADLEAIFASVKNLNTNFGFAENSRPFYFQEVIDFGGEAVSKQEYNSFGAVLEFLYGTTVGAYFQAQNGNKLANLQAFGPDWGLLEGYDAVAFIDNHDNQRHGTSAILTYKSAKLYKAAIAFMLAHPYGITRIMSSYAFDDADAGPPADSNGNIVGPGLNDDGTCTNGWVCEHRWQEIFNMVAFRNAAGTEEITNWWSNGDQQIAFGRGSKAFIAFTISGDLNQSLQTSLPAGTYCDVISGSLVNGACTGKSVVVDSNGLAGISLAADELDAAVAIHVNARL